MKYLITGGAGFIGKNFLYYMFEKHPGEEYICLDKLTYASNLDDLRPLFEKENFSFYQMDICDREAVFTLFEKERPDVVVNFAAESHVDRSIEDPSIFIKTNVEGTGVLLDACVKYGIKRFHQISTDEVYGDMPVESEELFTEGSVLKPSSPYSASKAAADLLCLSYHRTYGLPVTVSRSGNNIGHYQHEEKLIPKVISYASQNKEIPVYGTGENIRDWIDVRDHCAAVDLILQKGKEGEIYNIGAHQEISNIDLIGKILDCLEKPHSLITYVEDRKGHDLRYALDTSRINALGWSPLYTIEGSLERVLCDTLKQDKGEDI